MLWNLFKGLAEDCPIYLNKMDEETTPLEYVVIEETVSDSTLANADGKPWLRLNGFNIKIYTQTYENGVELSKKYSNIIFGQDNFSYNVLGTIWDSRSNTYATLISGNYWYMKEELEEADEDED
jgi:hypothetical protein